MKFYKVKPEADQTPTTKGRKRTGILIANELYTENEAERRGITAAQIAQCTETVEVSKKGTFWFFGARFTGSVNIQNTGK